MPDDDRLAISVTHADGRVTRWGFDAVDAGEVPSGLQFGSSVPGGYKDLSCNLLRDLNPRADEGLFDDVRVYGPGNETVWQGRIAQLPRSNRQLVPGAVGWSAHLEDDRSFREVYVDRDRNKWGGPGLQRTIDVAGLRQPFIVEVKQDATNPAVAVGFQAPFDANAVAEAWYDAGAGLTIGSIYYSMVSDGVITPANTLLYLVASPVDTASPFSATANIAGTSASGTFTPATAYRYAFVQLTHTTAATDNQARRYLFRHLVVFGNHGLTKRGTAPDEGLYASDIVANVVARAAPLLRYTTGTDGTIEQTAFVIPHAVFDEPTTAADVIARVNAYELKEWAVWENRTFYYRTPGPRTVWNARLGEGAKLDLEGDQAADIYNGVLVSYTDALGAKRTVGPPGATADATDSALADTSDLNPVNAHGIPRRWARLDLSTPTTQSGATQIGAVYLAEQSLAKRRGSITVQGSIEKDGQSGRYPVSRIRAGDYVTVVDRAGEPLRRIIEASYDHSSRTASLSLDHTSNATEAILERIGIVLQGVI